MPVLNYAPPSFPGGIPYYHDIYIHRLAEKELRSYYEGDALKEAVLLSNLKQRLQYLHDHMGMEFTHKQWFEVPKKQKPFRFIRFNRIKLLDNLRIIYCVVDNRAYLLSVFCEKRTSDYDSALELAKARIPV